MDVGCWVIDVYKQESGVLKKKWNLPQLEEKKKFKKIF